MAHKLTTVANATTSASRRQSGHGAKQTLVIAFGSKRSFMEAVNAAVTRIAEAYLVGRSGITT
ncbi:hypothetical protein [Bradyrhizobium sp. Tv2a-2]|uniref:hypothetical protein n=1 Tax=Bradyrhizobium sp. Tv2a-2 TaxID=113395 RepID=UPI0004159BBC|nr:hypothetical protein [Bradyrhizobium sp. Tv2a-2]